MSSHKSAYGNTADHARSSLTSAALKAKNPTTAEAPIDALPDFVNNFIKRPSR
jgi:hypothetical protein